MFSFHSLRISLLKSCLSFIVYSCLLYHRLVNLWDLYPAPMNDISAFVPVPYCFDQSPRVMKIFKKMNKWDLIKLKRFSTAKETINKKARQPKGWKKIFANKVTSKVFTSKIYKIYRAHEARYQQEQKTQSENGQKILIDISSGIHMTKKHMKRISTSLIIKVMQIKTTMRYHLTLIRIAIIKKSTND